MVVVTGVSTTLVVRMESSVVTGVSTTLVVRMEINGCSYRCVNHLSC